MSPENIHYVLMRFYMGDLILGNIFCFCFFKLFPIGCIELDTCLCFLWDWGLFHTVNLLKSESIAHVKTNDTQASYISLIALCTSSNRTYAHLGLCILFPIFSRFCFLVLQNFPLHISPPVSENNERVLGLCTIVLLQGNHMDELALTEHHIHCRSGLLFLLWLLLLLFLNMVLRSRHLRHYIQYKPNRTYAHLGLCILFPIFSRLCFLVLQNFPLHISPPVSKNNERVLRLCMIVLLEEITWTSSHNVDYC